MINTLQKSDLQSNITIGHHLGFSFTPLDGKRPILDGWQSRKRETLDDAIQWGEQHNVGLRCGSISAPDGKYLIVIDQDAGGDVAYLNLPPTLAVETGRGKHFYFYSTKPLKNSAGKLGEHIDTRGEGGQVVYPGSVHPDTGEPYRWMEGRSPSDIAIANLPEHIEQQLESSVPKPKRNLRYAQTALQKETDNVRNAVEGTRNDTLNRAAFSLGTLVAAGHLNATETVDSLLSAAMDAGLSRSEAMATIQSGMCSGQEHPREIKTTLTHQRRGGAVAAAKESRPWPLTDLGNADRLVYYYGDLIRFCAPWGTWLIWDGVRWKKDDSLSIQHLAKKTALTIWDEAKACDDSDVRANISKHANRSQGAARLDAMIQLARCEVPIRQDELDQNQWLLNCENGTVDLKTGELRPHNPQDFLTQLANVKYDSNATSPTWDAFLNRIMNKNQELIEYLQKLAGMCLTGDISQQQLYILYGTGANGKNTFTDTLMYMLGDYASEAAPDLLVMKNQSEHPTEIADLFGKRLIVAAETEEGQKLKIQLVKRLTGNATLKARYMRQDYFEFERTHKTWLHTNNKPVVDEQTNAVWRRLRLIPFSVTIPEAEWNLHLADKLKFELPGIFNWCLGGCLAWQHNGLQEPVIVRQATSEYQNEQHPLIDFFNECCEFVLGGIESMADVYAAYTLWAENHNINRPVTSKKFGQELRQKGCITKSERVNGEVVKCWNGICLRKSVT